MRAKVLQCFLVFVTVLSGVLLSKTFAAFGDNTAKRILLQKDIRTFAATHSAPFQFTKLHLPFESAPVSKDREIPDENETEEDSDYDFSIELEQATLFSIFDFERINSRVTQPETFIANRTAVPLFVLYHSWKSFMS